MSWACAYKYPWPRTKLSVSLRPSPPISPKRYVSLHLKPYSLIQSAHLSHHHRVHHREIRNSSVAAVAMGAGKTMEESDVGISCYISKLPGFVGILKQRYADFIVNEVDLDGNVVRLTSLDLPPEMTEKEESKVPDRLNKNFDTELEFFRSLVGDSDTDSLKCLIDKIQNGADDSTSPIVLSPSSDKAHRTAVHNFFKEKLKFLVTDTVDGPEASSKCIRVRFNSGGNQNRGRSSRKRKERGDKPFDSRGSEDWPVTRGKFLRFHLYKENKDTQETLRIIGKMLGIQSKSFGFSGTKDKRAVTTQRVTVFKMHASRLASLNNRLIGIKVGNFCYVNDGLLLGQLLGNRFTITLRGVVADSQDIIKESADALGKQGFINYFGLQRFGSGTVPTHIIGAALLRGEWSKAVDLILDPREGDILFLDDVAKVREYYKETNDIDRTLQQLPYNLVAERAILQCLKQCPGNHLQALIGVPRTLRMMYVHSYQSYLWNHAASALVQKYGARGVVLGDLVYSKDNTGVTSLRVCSCKHEDDFEEDLTCSNLDELPELDFPADGNQCVKVVDADDLVKGTYTIDDVVLPLPGSRAIYPANDIADIYHDLAGKDKISLTENAHNIKEFSITSMTGGYRRVFQKPLDFGWEILTYTDGNRPLAETDLDIILKSNGSNGARLQQDTANGTKFNHSDSGILSDVRSNEEASKTEADSAAGESDYQTQTALKLQFTLPASSYATMAIRELLKTSTSVAFHKTLNHRT
ncbi:hypothetical protein Droror1_Dr00024789 [Drosera rotundifolia]